MGYRYGPVVAGVDGSADSVGALRWAADEARRHSRELLTVHVLRPAERPGERAEPVAELAATEAGRWLPGVCATGVTETGDTVEVLRRHSRDARLVVIGSHGAGGVDGKPLGGVAGALCQQAHCPVLIVQAGGRWADPFAVLPQTGPVMVGFDGSDPDRRALRLGFEEAASRCSRLVVVQIWQHPDLWRPEQRRHCPDLAAEMATVDEALRAAAGPWHRRYPSVEVELRSEPGDPADALILASQWAMLMVLGPRRVTGPARPADPPVMPRVLRQMACPALIAHDPGRPPGVPPAAAATGPA